jgi:hypothetical protein
MALSAKFKPNRLINFLNLVNVFPLLTETRAKRQLLTFDSAYLLVHIGGKLKWYNESLRQAAELINNKDVRVVTSVCTEVINVYMNHTWTLIGIFLSNAEEVSPVGMPCSEMMWLCFFRIMQMADGQVDDLSLEELWSLHEKVESDIQQGVFQLSCYHWDSLHFTQPWMRSKVMAVTQEAMRLGAVRLGLMTDHLSTLRDKAAVFRDETNSHMKADHLLSSDTCIKFVHHQAWCAHRYSQWRTVALLPLDPFCETDAFRACCLTLQRFLNRIIHQGLPSKFINDHSHLHKQLMMPLGSIEWMSRFYAGQSARVTTDFISDYCTSAITQRVRPWLKHNMTFLLSGAKSMNECPWGNDPDSITSQLDPEVLNSMWLCAFAFIWDTHCTMSPFVPTYVVSFQQTITNEAIVRVCTPTRHGKDNPRRPMLIQLAHSWLLTAPDHATGRVTEHMYEFDSLLPALVYMIWLYSNLYYGRTECQEPIPLSFSRHQACLLVSQYNQFQTILDSFTSRVS